MACNIVESRTEQAKSVHTKYIQREEKKAIYQARANLPLVSMGYLSTGLQRDQLLHSMWDGFRQYTDESANDQAFMNKLAYWCNGNMDQMISAFLSSPYAQQKDPEHVKKIGREDYLKRTALKAVQDLKSTAAGDQAEYQHQQAVKAFSPAASGVDTQQIRLDTISAQDLQSKNLEPLRFVVKGMLPQGLAILASPPKYGKSWFVLDLCLSVSAGKPFLRHETVKGSCLYLALEDSLHRLQDRMSKILLFGEKAPAGFDYAIKSETLAGSLVEQLALHMKEKPETSLIVIDTLQKIRGAANGKESAYSADYKELGILKAFADEHKICLLLVHHLRKAADDSDVFNRISGTNGISGAADTMFVLSRAKRTDSETTLSVIGRDVNSSETILEFSKSSFCWVVLGDAEEQTEQQALMRYQLDPLRQTIVDLVKNNPQGWTGTASELFQACIEYAGQFGAETPSEIGKKLKGISRRLFEVDGIIYRPPNPNGGAGGRKHTVTKRKSLMEQTSLPP